MCVETQVMNLTFFWIITINLLPVTLTNQFMVIEKKEATFAVVSGTIYEGSSNIQLNTIAKQLAQEYKDKM